MLSYVHRDRVSHEGEGQGTPPTPHPLHLLCPVPLDRVWMPLFPRFLVRNPDTGNKIITVVSIKYLIISTTNSCLKRIHFRWCHCGQLNQSHFLIPLKPILRTWGVFNMCRYTTLHYSIRPTLALIQCCFTPEHF